MVDKLKGEGDVSIEVRVKRHEKGTRNCLRCAYMYLKQNFHSNFENFNFWEDLGKSRFWRYFPMLNTW